MGKIFLLLLLFLGLEKSGAQEITGPLLTVAQLQEDLDTLYAQLQANHPRLFAQWRKAEADAAFQKLRAQIKQPLDRLRFRTLMAPFVARFNDGHIYIESEFDMQELALYEKGGGRLFPLQVLIAGDRLYSVDSAGNGLQKGDEIFALNGKKSKAIISLLRAATPGDDARTATITVQRLFGFLLWLELGWGTGTDVQFRSRDGIKTTKLPGITRQQYTDRLFSKGQFRFLHLYPEESLAVIQINEYAGLSKSKAFIDSAFRVIKEKGIQHVALDLRRNGGGNSAIGDHVLAYITKKQYRTVRSKTWKDGPLMQALDTSNWRYPMIAAARKSWILISPLEYKTSFEPAPPGAVETMDVKFYLLTSGRTFSSAHMTALAVKCGALGTIIGQPTGERLDLTGEIAPFVLPHSRFPVWVPTAVFETACGAGSQVGVMPDHIIPVRIEDLKTGRDGELEFLRTLIRQKD